MLNNKKGVESLVSTKSIAIILVVLVIVVVLIFIFKPDILSGIRGLPEWEVKDEPIDASGLSDFELGNICPIRVARIMNGKDIMICEDNRCNDNKLIISNLRWRGDRRTARIEVAQLFDNDIGEVKLGKITLYNEILERKGKLYDKVKKDLPTQEFLLKLNEANLINLGNLICRKEEVK